MNWWAVFGGFLIGFAAGHLIADFGPALLLRHRRRDRSSWRARRSCGRRRVHVGESLPVLMPGETAEAELVEDGWVLDETSVHSDARTVWQVYPSPGRRAAFKRWTYRWFGVGL